jgi:phospholipase/lecithinase/hemolysin
MARYLALAGSARPAFRSVAQEASNYPVGGARAVAGYPCRVNLPDQVGMYLADFGVTPPRTLVAIEIGGNDVRDALVAAAMGQDPGPYIANALGSLSQEVVRLYLSGAQRFLILNVADVGKTPAVQMLDRMLGAGGAVIGAAGSLSNAHNGGLVLVVGGLQAALPGIDIRTLDVHATRNSVVANPGTCGFVNATDACITPNQPPFGCAKPDRYVFRDGIHPTQALHAIVAQHAIAVISAP